MAFHKQQLLQQLGKLKDHVRRQRDYPNVTMTNTKDEIVKAIKDCCAQVFKRKPDLKTTFENEAKQALKNDTTRQSRRETLSDEFYSFRKSSTAVESLFNDADITI